ncbi:MAG: GldG family protein [Phycisphaerales bacterium]
MNKGLFTIIALLAAALIFVGVNVLAGAALRGARADLTQGHLYTLSQGSRRIAASLAEPITLTLYYSQKQSNQLPALKSYGTRVKEVLQEYARASKGKIKLDVVDPEPFSAEEDKAVAAELLAAPVARAGTSADRFFFGLVGVNSTDHQEKIPFFRPDREEFLEYDLTRLVYLLSEPKKKSVGVMSWLPINGSDASNPMMRQQPAPPWILISQMREVFDVKPIPTDAPEIPSDISVLLIVHPKNMSETTQYAVDQFVLRGGHAVVFVDPLCETDVPPGINPMQAMNLPKSSDLPRLFDAWGVQVTKDQFAADRANAVKVQIGSQAKPEVSDYIAYIQLREKLLDHDDPITGQLNSVFFATAGVITKKGDVGTTLTPLAWTSTESQLLPTSSVSFFPEPKKLLADFRSGDEALTLAARITGKVKSAFPAGRPAPPPPKPAAPGEPPAPTPAADPDPNFIPESKDPINVVVVADCDMLADRFWVSESRIGNITLGYNKFNDNGDLAINAIDNLSGSSDLISVRARGTFARPFDRVESLEKDAQKKYAEEEQKLEARLRETEQEINNLQKQRTDSAGASAFFLTPEQQTRIDKFNLERAQTKKDLRQVRHNLTKDIENLGTRLKFLNIGLMPILVGVTAVGLGFWRASRRRAERWKTKPRD